MLLARLFAALAALYLCSAAPALAEDPPFTPTRFSVEVSGTGPDVIFIPGLSTPRDVWAPFAAKIAARHRVHLVQIKGFGEPAGPNAEGPVLQPFVDELARYVEANGVVRPAVIGHSLGGLAALMLGSEHPELPGRLMIVDAFPWYGVIVAPGVELTVAQIEPQARTMRDAMVASHGRPADPAALEATIASFVVDKSNLPLLREWAARIDQRVAGQLVYEDLTADLRERIASITAPVTLVFPWSEAMPQARAEPFYRQHYANAPQTRFVGIGPAAHFVMLDRPDDFMAALEAFLAE
jgi:pimeloyl-[acyl-carrier protein] methyl ester esterase